MWYIAIGQRVLPQRSKTCFPPSSKDTMPSSPLHTRKVLVERLLRSDQLQQYVYCAYQQVRLLSIAYLTADGSPVVAVGQLIGSHEANVLCALLEGLYADVLEDVFDPHPCPHRVGHGRRPPRKPDTRGCFCRRHDGDTSRC